MFNNFLIIEAALAVTGFHAFYLFICNKIDRPKLYRGENSSSGINLVLKFIELITMLNYWFLVFTLIFLIDIMYYQYKIKNESEEKVKLKIKKIGFTKK